MDKPRGRKWIEAKLPDMFTEITKRARQIPSPDHYQKNLQVIGQNKKFYSSKLPRTTEIDMIFKTKKAGPTPFSYNPNPIKSRRKFFSSKLDRSGFIEDARARANDSPPPYVAKYTLVQPRLKGLVKSTATGIIKQPKNPECCAYNPEKGLNLTVKRIRATSISKYVLPLIQDLKIKHKKLIPGVGSYKWENSFEK